MADITIVGGGLAGLVASIASAEARAKVHLYEAHATLGGGGVDQVLPAAGILRRVVEEAEATLRSLATTRIAAPA